MHIEWPFPLWDLDYPQTEKAFLYVEFHGHVFAEAVICGVRYGYFFVGTIMKTHSEVVVFLWSSRYQKMTAAVGLVAGFDRLAGYKYFFLTGGRGIRQHVIAAHQQGIA